MLCRLCQYGHPIRRNNLNSIERELNNVINGPEGQGDLESFVNRGNYSQENKIRNIHNDDAPIRQNVLEDIFEFHPNELDARISREIDSLKNAMQTQISKISMAISSAVSNRVIPEIQNAIGNLLLNQNGIGTSASLYE